MSTNALSQDSASPSRRPLGAIALVVVACVCSCVALASGYWIGNRDKPQLLPPMLAASAASSDAMAVATGPISKGAEGIFFLDFITGDLQCLVYYPRAGVFGAHFYTNVSQHLGGGGKNGKYLMVTGQAVRSSTTGGAQPGGSLVYVTDVTNGTFAAYAVPWDRNAESTSRSQSGPLVFAGGGPIRNYQLRDPGQKAPAAIVDPNQK